MSHDDRLTTSEVAQRFRVQPATVLRWVDEKRIKPVTRRPVRRGALLFRLSDIEALEQAHAPGTETRTGNPTVADIAAIIASEVRKPRRVGT